MAGYPSEKATLAAVRGLIQGGTDIIELGFPFFRSNCRWTNNPNGKY